MAGKKEKKHEEPAPDAEGGEEGAAKKKGLSPLILFGGLGALILVLGGAAAFLLLGGKKDDAHADAESEAHGEEHADAGGHGDDSHGGKGAGDKGHGKAAKSGGKGHGDDHAAPPAAAITFYTLPDLLVNIQSDSDRPSYLKLKLTLELASPDLVAQIEPAMPRVMDRFQSFLRELRIDDFAGSAGSYRLRLELLRRVNLAVAPAEVRAVLIEEMLIQ